MSEIHNLVRLYDIFSKYGLDVRGGVYPWHFDRLYPTEVTRLHRALPFMGITKKREKIVVGAGISPIEMMFCSALLESFAPKNIFIIGNSFGWSTFAFALACPQSKIVVIDAVIEGYDNQAMFDMTQHIIEKEGFGNVTLVKAVSPQDVDAVVESHMTGTIDVALIDGDHTNEQQAKDFQALYPHLSTQSIVLFHDVLNWDLVESFRQLRAQYSHLASDILMRTPSGMGVFYSRDIPESSKKIIAAFVESKENIRFFQGYTKTRMQDCIERTGLQLHAYTEE